MDIKSKQGLTHNIGEVLTEKNISCFKSRTNIIKIYMYLPNLLLYSSPDLYCEKKPWSKIEFSYQDLVKLFHQKEPPKAGHQLVLDLSTEELTQIPP